MERKFSTSRAEALYNHQIDDFKSALTKDRAAAYARFGMTMFYSLDDADILEEVYRIREPKTALDFYNLGVHANQREDHAKARSYYEQALALLTEAKKADSLPKLQFNLGATLEALGDTERAKTHYLKYVEILSSRDRLSAEDKAELESIREHCNGL